MVTGSEGCKDFSCLHSVPGGGVVISGKVREKPIRTFQAKQFVFFTQIGHALPAREIQLKSNWPIRCNICCKSETVSYYIYSLYSYDIYTYTIYFYFAITCHCVRHVYSLSHENYENAISLLLTIRHIVKFLLLFFFLFFFFFKLYNNKDSKAL
jgi:hypothetical protein